MRHKIVYMKISDCVKWLVLLLLVVLMPACNEDGEETIVIEDGQPSAAELIIGKWFPNKWEHIDEDGNVTEQPVTDNIPGLNFYEDGTFDEFEGGSDDSGSTGGGNHKWDIDEGLWNGGGDYNEEGPSISLDGERWYIFQLTKSMLIIYRVTDRYIILYYYYRVGDFNGTGNNENPEPGLSKVTRIVETIDYVGSDRKSVSTYSIAYNDDNRVSNYTITNGNYSYSFDYTYNGNEQVYIEGDEEHSGLMNGDGYLTLVDYQSAAAVTGARASYNEEGYLISFNNEYFFTYDKNGNLTVMDNFSYEYGNEKNDANIDLNCIISNCSNYEVAYSHFSLFAPFGFYGKASAAMISKEVGKNYDWYSTYTYERDEEGRLTQIVRKSINAFNGEILNVATFDVSYD